MENITISPRKPFFLCFRNAGVAGSTRFAAGFPFSCLPFAPRHSGIGPLSQAAPPDTGGRSCRPAALFHPSGPLQARAKGARRCRRRNARFSLLGENRRVTLSPRRSASRPRAWARAVNKTAPSLLRVPGQKERYGGNPCPASRFAGLDCRQIRQKPPGLRPGSPKGVSQRHASRPRGRLQAVEKVACATFSRFS